ncbi:hypothetical protein [Bradyrhizobium neotropicale]|nr:hypothetical protein [Bradyrhizobium neotropicale]MBO4227216.1 hypothetical protein [Bradyrhizobium neotropicale]
MLSISARGVGLLIIVLLGVYLLADWNKADGAFNSSFSDGFVGGVR